MHSAKREKAFRDSKSAPALSTSIGANVEEALAGRSRKDFFAKMSIASKEARETNYWLRLIQDSSILDGKLGKNLIESSEELIKILTSIVKTGYGKDTKTTVGKTQN